MSSELPVSPGLVKAMDYWHPQDSIVDTAARVADAVSNALRGQRRLTVSLKGLRGISSSFANILLQRIVADHGSSALDERVLFETDSHAQAEVLRRSIEAVKAAS